MENALASLGYELKRWAREAENLREEVEALKPQPNPQQQLLPPEEGSDAQQ